MEWPLSKLGDVCDLVGGGTPSKSNESFYGGKIPWATVRDMQKDLLSTTELSITDEAVKKSSTNLIPSGTIITATRVGLGKVCILQQDTAINQDIKAIIPKTKSLDNGFLYWWLKSIAHVIEAAGTGATVKGVKLPFIKSVKIPLPPLPEQKRIVAILDKAFAHIDQARALAEQNLKNARELFESYLQNVFSQPGEGWVERSLEEVSLDFGRGKSKHRPRNDLSLYGGVYPFIQTGDVRNCEHIITSYSQTYNEKGLAQSKLWPKGTICITIAANIAETGILGFESCFPDSVIGVVVDPGVTTVSYVEYLLQSFKVILQAKGKGSAQDNINMGTFENMKFPFPSLSMQNAIVGNMSKLMVSVQHLEKIYVKKIEALGELKKSILQKAFSGELTVKHAVEAVA